MSNTPIAQIAASTIKGTEKRNVYPKTIDKAVLTTDKEGNEQTLDKVLIKGVEVNGTPITPNEYGVIDISGVGKSAYQSYLDTTTDDPPMTEEEWVESLNGEDGKDGIDGTDGVGFSSVSTPVTPNGTFTILLSNGDTMTIDLHHNHPQYAVTKVTDSNTGAITKELNPFTFYYFSGALTSLSITLATTNSDTMPIYAGKFTADSNGCSLSIPSTVTPAIGNPAIEASKTYEFNIFDNILILLEV